jgi:hypothetical protein
LAAWNRGGRVSNPPQLYKYSVIKEYAARHGLRLFIETGTNFGDAVQATIKVFDRIYSIELGDELFQKAFHRFRRSPHVTILHGDSGKVLKTLLPKVELPAVFWLDGHYSGGITARGDKDTPIVSELESILIHPVKKHVVLIDDARCFDGSNGYPTVSEIRNLIIPRYPNASFELTHDIIRVCFTPQELT